MYMYMYYTVGKIFADALPASTKGALYLHVVLQVEDSERVIFVERGCTRVCTCKYKYMYM